MKLLLCPFAIIVGTAGAAAFVGDKSKQHDIIPISSCSSNTKFAHPTKHDSLPMDDPRVEPRVMHKMDISLPLGLTLEEMDSDPSCGVVIVGISPGGNAGEASS